MFWILDENYELSSRKPEVDIGRFQWHYNLLLNRYNSLFLMLMLFFKINLRLCPEKNHNKKKIITIIDGFENPKWVIWILSISRSRGWLYKYAYQMHYFFQFLNIVNEAKGPIFFSSKRHKTAKNVHIIKDNSYI